MTNKGERWVSRCPKVWSWSERERGKQEVTIVFVFPNVGIVLNNYLSHRTRLRLSAVSNCQVFHIKEHERCQEGFHNMNNEQQQLKIHLVVL